MVDAATYLAQHPKTLLSPETTHRADGSLLLGSKHMSQFGAKFYSKDVPSGIVRSEYRSTDPAAAYELKMGYKAPTAPDRFNSHAAKPRAAWVLAALDSRVALRVHVSIPRAQEPSGEVEPREFTAGTFVLPDSSIVVNLDKTNLHLLLGEPRAGRSRTAEDDVLRAVYRLLFQVTGATEFAELAGPA